MPAPDEDVPKGEFRPRTAGSTTPWRNYRAAGLAKCHGPPTQEGPGPRGRELRNIFFNFVSKCSTRHQCLSDPEQPQQGTSKNQSEPYFSVNNIASSPYVTDKGSSPAPAPHEVIAGERGGAGGEGYGTSPLRIQHFTRGFCNAALFPIEAFLASG
ncbi:hypothetical protein EVAR_67527_1 [Eumeta japonica]|uniref:Uncharacterized protein n=1 Tax=Eumeta variegata TaxID=151549 RepID=A0A4C1YTF5_EUMVA|nr:hypothetical protein EVAR_67527_1 [Eumeta japonica]